VGRFLEDEKRRYVAWKQATSGLADAARRPGEYRGQCRLFCLPQECAEENLFPGIRESVTAYFRRREIKWHDGRDRRPSVHLCDSQVCCVNFLFPFARQPEALGTLLRPLYPDLVEMLPVEDGLYVAHEWIGARNYLHEVSRNGIRTRGANYTSADAIVRFRRADGSVQVVLIEWKYTESPGGTNVRYARSGKDKTTIYRPFYERACCPLDRTSVDRAGFEALFYEPFYQLMRQQFLAHEMERAKELDADIVSLLLIAPAHNGGFRRVTSPALRQLGASATDVRARLVAAPDRYRSVNTEALFARLVTGGVAAMARSGEYIRDRYPWVLQI